MNSRMNTIAMAVLTAGLIGMVTGKATEFLYDGGPKHPGVHEEATRGYKIEVTETAATGALGQSSLMISLILFPVSISTPLLKLAIESECGMSF